MNLKSNKSNNQSSLIYNQLKMPSTSVENVRQISHILCQTNPISERLKLMQSIYLQRVMKIKQDWGFVKTKPIKANNQSSLIDNQLLRQIQFEPKQTQSSLSSNVVVGDPVPPTVNYTWKEQTSLFEEANLHEWILLDGGVADMV